MARYLRDGANRGTSSGTHGFGRLERVTTAVFCECRRCTSLAAWRIGYGLESVEFCPRHTLSTMRNQRLWTGWA